MGLDNFLIGNEQAMENKKIVFLDLYNMIFRYIHVAHKSNPLDDEFKDWRYMMTWGIMNIAKDFKPDQFIIAVDGGASWRKNVYPDYKGQREGNRKESAIDFEKFFPVMEEYIELLKKILTNVYILRSPNIEADDFIAVLTKRFGTFNEIVNISTDKDFYQLYRYNGYKQYNPIQKKYIQVLKPDLELHVKLLTGDSSDNIPQVRPKMGPKTAEKFFEKLDDLFEDEVHGEFSKEQYIINKKLIDFDMIPQEIQNKINELYDNYNFQPYKGRNTLSCFTKYRLTKSIGYIQEFNDAFNNLKSYEELVL